MNNKLYLNYENQVCYSNAIEMLMEKNVGRDRDETMNYQPDRTYTFRLGTFTVDGEKITIKFDKMLITKGENEKTYFVVNETLYIKNTRQSYFFRKWQSTYMFEDIKIRFKLPLISKLV